MDFVTNALSQLTAGVIAYSLLDLGKFWKNQKFYINQQVMQMQAHYLNKNRLINSAKGKTKEVLTAIFIKYEATIGADNCCWIKTKDNLFLVKMEKGKVMVNNKWEAPGCYVHRGFFPPSMPIYATMQRCTKNIDTNNVSVLQNKSLVDAWNDMEFLVLQLEALEQDMAAIKL